MKHHPKKKALLISGEQAAEEIYGGQNRERIEELVELMAPPLTREGALAQPDLLREMEICLSGWGAPRFDEDFLALCPKLEAVFYGAGSVKGLVTEAFWGRKIILTSSWAANALPVAEFTLAQVILCLKGAYPAARAVREQRKWVKPRIAGTYGSTVGIISLGMIGRLVAERLLRLDVDVIAYDPFFPVELEEQGVRNVSLLELFRTSDVITLHAPWLPETENLINGALFKEMKPGASFLNTARGAVVNEPEMIEVLKNRPDLHAILDVTYPEPPPEDSALYTLPNVVLTPHIAGSVGPECLRLGEYAVRQLEKYLAGQPLDWAITRQQAEIMA